MPLTWVNNHRNKDIGRSREALRVSGVLQSIDRLEVVFDEESLVAEGGLLVAATLA